MPGYTGTIKMIITAYDECDQDKYVQGYRRLCAEVLCTAYQDLKVGSRIEVSDALWWFKTTVDPHFKFYGLAFHEIASFLRLNDYVLRKIEDMLPRAEARLMQLRLANTSLRYQFVILDESDTLSSEFLV